MSKDKTLAQTLLSLGVSIDDKHTAYYGCVKCQQCHYHMDPLFIEHTRWQDKNGAKTVKRIKR